MQQYGTRKANDVDKTSGRPTAVAVAVSLLVYFPYVGLVPGFDVQPFFFAIGLLGVGAIVLLRKVYVSIPAIVLAALFFALVLIRFLFQGARIDSESVLSFAITGFHISVLFLCWAFVKTGLFRTSKILLSVVITIYVGVGAIQLVFPDFLSSVVYRGDQDLAHTGRGVRSLASEPAVFGYLLTLLNVYAVYVIAFKDNLASKRQIFWVSLGLFCANVVLSQSFYSAAFHLGLLLLLFLFTDVRLFAVGLITSGALAAILLAGAPNAPDSRLFRIAEIVWTNPLLLYEQGAFLRVLNVPISIYGGVLHGPLGSGFAPDQMVQGAIPVVQGVPYYFSVGDRNMGGAVEFFLRMGLISIPVLVWYFAALLRVSRISVKTRDGRLHLGVWAAVAIFMLGFLYNSMANPLIWVILFLFLEQTQAKKWVQPIG